MRRITVVLLVVQASNALLASLLQAVAFKSLAGVLGSAALLALAWAVAKEVRMARRVVVVAEIAMLLGTLPRLLQSVQAHALPDAAWILGDIGLPVAVLYSLRIRSGADGVLPGLVAVSGVVHLSLVPEHGVLFMADAALLLALAVGLIRDTARWRMPAAVVLLINLIGYLVAIGPGREGVDALGASTKLTELVAFGLLLPLSFGRMAMLTATSLVTGGVVWAASGVIAHSHTALAAPTYEQRIAAEDLVTATREDTAGYADPARAVAAGYHVTTPGPGPTHYVNDAYEHDSVVLDPRHPEGLVYVNTMLVGALYIMPRLGVSGPTPGGSLTPWHTHSVCISLPLPALAGLATPWGACPPFTFSIGTPEMMHVWTIDNPGGQYADELDPKVVARLSR